MGRSLPPLTQLRSFAAVAAHGRLNRAAAALGLTESAVSHHLRKLEGALGARLLERGREQAVLTPAGERFHARVREALRLLDEAVEEVSGATRGKVVLTLPRALATHWLVPRYPTLYRGEQDLELQLLPTARLCNLEREQIDLGIRLGHGQWAGLEARRLMPERILPLATPALARAWRERGWDASFEDRRLIANATHPDEWYEWCRVTGRRLPGDARFTTLESFDLVLQAGLAGSGLIMGRTPMVDGALARGELVTPFAEPVASGAAYHVVWPRSRPPNRHAQVVLQWLLGQAAQSSTDE